jgi:NAD(P)-dependent dehydrogenase (short-subunit alcohol dehydrogenase family)
MKLKNKISVITGAGRGIGRSIALAFAEEGSDLVLAARTKQQLEEVAQEADNKGRKVAVVSCDVSSPREVQRLAKKVRDVFGRADILVNNAGISKRSKFLEYDDETWLEVIRVNLFGAYLCTKAFLPMIQQAKKGSKPRRDASSISHPLREKALFLLTRHTVHLSMASWV